MSNIPKIVLARLKADANVATHPDADLLTAFAEQSLPARERAGVFEHLARCADCREVVAMALPAMAETAAVVVEDRSSRFVWPLLRWGFATVGVLLIGWFGVRLLQQSHNSDNLAKVSEPRIAEQANSTSATNTPPVMPTVPDAAKNSAKAADAAKSSGYASSAPSVLTKQVEPATEAEKASTAADHQPRRAMVGGTVATGVPGGPLASMQQQQQQVAATGAAGSIAGKQALPSAQPGTVSEAVNVSGAAPQIAVPDSDTLKNDAQNEVALSRDMPSPVQPEESNEKMLRAKPAQAPSASAGSQAAAGARLKAPSAPAANLPVNGRDFTQIVATRSVAIPKWNISAGGSLQRSFDQGGTWQDVNVLAETVPPNQFASYDALSQSSVTDETSRSKEKDTEKKVATGKSSPLTFRAVTANGADVWAGGARGILYHSSDGGNHWSRVIPFAAGITLTGDIVGLEFSDPQHGRLTTSFAEIWTTSDAGQAWQKQ